MAERCRLYAVEEHGRRSEVAHDLSALFAATKPGERRLGIGRAAGQAISSMGVPPQYRLLYSRQHAQLAVDNEGRLLLCDKGAANGTFVNNRRLATESPTPLKDGDVISFGGGRILTPANASDLAGNFNPMQFVVSNPQALRTFGRQQDDDSGASAASVTESAEGAPPSRSASPTSSLQRPAAAATTGAPLQRPASAAAMPAPLHHSQHGSPSKRSIFRLAVEGGEHRRADAPEHAMHADGGAAAVAAAAAPHAPADQAAAAGQQGSQGAEFRIQEQQRRLAIRDAVARLQGSTASLQAAAEAGRLRRELDRARLIAAQLAGGDAADSFGTEPPAPDSTPAAQPASDAATSDTAGSAQPQRLQRVDGSSQDGRPDGRTRRAEGATEGGSGVSGQALTSRLRRAAAPPPPPLPTATEVAVIVSSEDDMSFGDFHPAPRGLFAEEATEQANTAATAVPRGQGATGPLRQPPHPSHATAAANAAMGSAEGRQRTFSLQRRPFFQQPAPPEAAEVIDLLESSDDDSFATVTQRLAPQRRRPHPSSDEAGGGSERPTQAARTSVRQDAPTAAAAAKAASPAATALAGLAAAAANAAKTDGGAGPPQPAAAAAAGNGSTTKALEEQFECTICRDWMVATHSMVPCGHMFCGGCLGDWLPKNPTCPTCRIALEAPPVRSWAVDSLLDSLVAPTLPADEKADRATRKAAWEKESAATTKRWKGLFDAPRRAAPERGAGGAGGHWPGFGMHPGMENIEALIQHIRGPDPAFRRQVNAQRNAHRARRPAAPQMALPHPALHRDAGAAGSSGGRSGQPQARRAFAQPPPPMPPAAAGHALPWGHHSPPPPPPPHQHHPGLAAYMPGGAAAMPPGSGAPPAAFSLQHFAPRGHAPPPPVPPRAPQPAPIPAAALGLAPGQLVHMVAGYASRQEQRRICHACSRRIDVSTAQLTESNASGGPRRRGGGGLAFHLRCAPHALWTHMSSMPAGHGLLAPDDQAFVQHMWNMHGRRHG